MSTPENPLAPRTTERRERSDIVEHEPVIETVEQYVALAEELAANSEAISFANTLSESGEVISYTELLPSEYANLKGEEASIPNYTDYSTLVDDLIARFKVDAMKVVLGRDHRNVFIMPALGEEARVESDSLRPKHLNPDTIPYPKLRALVRAEQNWKNLRKQGGEAPGQTPDKSTPLIEGN